MNALTPRLLPPKFNADKKMILLIYYVTVFMIHNIHCMLTQRKWIQSCKLKYTNERIWLGFSQNSMHIGMNSQMNNLFELYKWIYFYHIFRKGQLHTTWPEAIIIRHAFKERIFFLILTNAINMQYQLLFAHFIAFSFFLCFFPWRCWSSPPWSVVTTWHTSHLEIFVIYI